MKVINTLLGIVLSMSATAIAADGEAVHGMLLFGKAKTYFSHLPMFHAPHDYQAIFEVQLAPAARNAYMTQANGAAPGEVFTAVPDAFSLPAMAANPQPFGVTLYKGHFERGGTAFTGRVGAQIVRVIHFRKFDPAAEAAAKLQYIAFGNGMEGFLAHFITGAPDFDHVIPVHGLDQEGIATALGDPKKPLQDNNRAVLDFGASKRCLPTGKTAYLEYDDLAH